jgi:UDP-N-acetylglucosamine 4,6-dehydratase
MTEFFRDKTILITGGTGFLGHAVTELLVNMPELLRPKGIRIYSRELSKQIAISKLSSNISFFTADIRDTKKLRSAMEGVDYVIHTAAMKDVTQCEKSPVEATYVNILGTADVIEAAVKEGVKRVLFTSSDKAVAPAGAMGISKAMAERVIMAKAESSFQAMADRENSPLMTIVRFGNLAGSAGTVIPLFIKQAKEGREITVTDPKMTRFLMTPQIAAQYTLFALEYGQNGDIIIQKTPSVSLYKIAECVVEMYGSGSNENKVKVIGARAGEKLFETMASSTEMAKAISLGEHYLRIPLKQADPADLNTAAQEYNSQNARPITDYELKSIIASIARDLNI